MLLSILFPFSQSLQPSHGFARVDATRWYALSQLLVRADTHCHCYWYALIHIVTVTGTHCHCYWYALVRIVSVTGMRWYALSLSNKCSNTHQFTFNAVRGTPPNIAQFRCVLLSCIAFYGAIHSNLFTVIWATAYMNTLI